MTSEPMAECWEGAVSELRQALVQPELLGRWQEHTAQDLQIAVERRLADHLQRLQRVALQLQAVGEEALRQTDPAAFDALLTDCFACATWNGWPLPARAAGHRIVPSTAEPGFLTDLPVADRTSEGAQVFCLDDHTVLLLRQRQIAFEADDPVNPPA